MKIAIGSDHRGFTVKQRIGLLLKQLGHEVTDLGANSPASSDYPDYAFAVAQAVGKGEVHRGVLVCGTGLGMCIAANKVSGVRAVPCHDAFTAEISRRHNDTNILCLSADMLGEELLEQMVKLWLTTEFEGGRHSRRLEKITRFEEEHHQG
jgi:ribose 5-phosphate isomerase B